MDLESRPSSHHQARERAGLIHNYLDVVGGAVDVDVQRGDHPVAAPVWGPALNIDVPAADAMLSA
jgi:hypothetical protein